MFHLKDLIFFIVIQHLQLQSHKKGICVKDSDSTQTVKEQSLGRSVA